MGSALARTAAPCLTVLVVHARPRSGFHRLLSVPGGLARRVASIPAKRARALYDGRAPFKGSNSPLPEALDDFVVANAAGYATFAAAVDLRALSAYTAGLNTSTPARSPKAAVYALDASIERTAPAAWPNRHRHAVDFAKTVPSAAPVDWARPAWTFSTFGPNPAFVDNRITGRTRLVRTPGERVRLRGVVTDRPPASGCLPRRG